MFGKSCHLLNRWKGRVYLFYFCRHETQHFGVYDLSGRVEECVVEGENVLNAGHLILTGKTQEHFGNIELYGLCPQSSSIDSNPQEITEKLCITIFE